MNKLRLRTKTMSIFSKVLFGNIMLVVVVLTLSGLLTYMLVRNYIITTAQQEMLGKAHVIADSIGRHTPDWRALRQYQNMSDAEIVIIDTNFVAVQSPARRNDLPEKIDEDAEIDVKRTEIISSVDQAIVASILSGNAETGLSRLEFIQNQIVYAGVPIYNTENVITGAVMLFRQLTDINLVWRRVSLYLSAAATAAIAIAVLIATVFSRKLTKPLTQMTNTARRMANGEYGDRVEIHALDEVGQLGETLNLLSGRLSEVIYSLYGEKNKLEKILSGIGEGIIAVDIRGDVVHVNTPALELLETDDYHTPSEQKTQLSAMLAICMDSGERETMNWINPSGRSLAAVASPIRDAAGLIAGAVVLMRDVSEAQRLEQLRRDYIANISHELRTPLTGIRGMVEPLIDGMLDTEEEKKNSYQVIYRETLRLQKLITEMLDMSRLQDGRLTVDLEALELTGILESAARSMETQARDAGITLTVDVKEPIMAMGNEDRITQVLIILIDNAVSFTPSGGVITVFAISDKRRARVGVKDTGAGIEPQHLPYIWERFYKADKSRMRTTGTGLGLAIAKLVVERMDGTIDVETELGKGSTFTFTLGLATERSDKNIS